ncbi:MAG: signal peptidase I, partial [Mycobacterium sp.]
MTGTTDSADSSSEPTPDPADSEAAETQADEADEAEDKSKRKGGVLREAAILLVIAVGLYYVMLTFVARPYLIPSESMEPTLHGCHGCVGDRIMVDKLTYRFSSPEPGDVIVFKGPPNWNIGYRSIRSDNTAVRWVQNTLSFVGFIPPDENDLVKRVIAVGGQTVQCRAATGLSVDGKPLNEPYLDTTTMMADPKVYPCLGNEFGPVKVPEDRLWVM